MKFANLGKKYFGSPAILGGAGRCTLDPQKHRAKCVQGLYLTALDYSHQGAMKLEMSGTHGGAALRA